MFALKCRRNYAISAESISISQSNIVLIVTAAISLICSGEPILPPRTFPSCRGQFGDACFLREELFLQQASLEAQATEQGVLGFVVACLCNFKHHTLTSVDTVVEWRMGSTAQWRCEDVSCLPARLLILWGLCHGAQQPKMQEIRTQHLLMCPQQVA